MIADPEMQKYFRELEDTTAELYKIAEEARAVGLDPMERTEVYKAKDLASRVEGLLGVKGVAERIRELDAQIGREKTAFIIIEEIINGKFGEYEDEEGADYALRTALAIVTEGITAAPLQGIDKVEIKRNPDRTSYLAIYYAGPMRSAGGTEQALTVLFAEKIRKLLHLDRYKINEQEVGRFIEELRLYERKVTNFQYHPSDEDLRRLLPYIPVEITGPATDNFQVSVYRNLPRIETNSVRGGALRVINDGVYGKAAKLKKIVDEVGITDWDWLLTIKKDGKKTVETTTKIVPESKYLVDIVGGRPIFSHPSRFGGFRLRYGRARNTGLACVGIHPATMVILESFIAVGTQLRVERPGKSATITPVDTIEGPIVKLKSGDVVRIEDEATAEKLHNDVSEILFIGDMCISVGEFLENNHKLMPAGYCEEIWATDLQKAVKTNFDDRYDVLADHLGLLVERLKSFAYNPLIIKPTAEEALNLSNVLSIPLHPRYTYYWEALGLNEILALKDWLSEPLKSWKVGPFNVHLKDQNLKLMLEKAGIPHRIDANSNIIFEDSPIIAALFNPTKCTKGSLENNAIKFLSEWACLTLREKGRSFIGARMGRPEKARERVMSPPTHVLFPVGLAGGTKRDLTKAALNGSYVVSIFIRHCKKCNRITFENVCSKCGNKTTPAYTCKHCEKKNYFMIDNQPLDVEKTCPHCNSQAMPFNERPISMEHYADLLKKFNMEAGTIVKGVKGLSNPTKIPEAIEKGILRSKHKVFVYKDGTVRFDITNAPLTHFKPSETRISIERLRQLGYVKDYFGRDLTDPEQLVELKVQDLIVPESCGEYLFRSSKYLDEMLEKVYRLKPYYNLNNPEDLVGHLVIGLAPHTSAGIIGRIIGFTKAAVCYAHPFWHAAKRRNCDGDEDAVMLTLETLIDFSKSYLPDKIGGLMDAPLVVTTVIDPSEVDDECHNMETNEFLPNEFYSLCNEYKDAKEALKYIKIMKSRLGTPEQYTTFSFSIYTNSIEGGPLRTAYDKIKSMMDKVEKQLQLADRIRSVDSRDVADRLLKHHFIPDLAGNLRAFSTQTVRCTKCGMKYRRIPLTGVCTKCKGNLILTVHEGNVNKYLAAAFSLTNQYDLGTFVWQQISLIQKGLRTLIPEKNEKEKEESKDMKLSQFLGSN